MKYYTDTLYGNRVTRLTDGDYNINFYYHQPSVLDGSRELMYLRFTQAYRFECRDIRAVNWETGATREVSGFGELISECGQGDWVYGFLYPDPQERQISWLGRLNVYTGEQERYAEIGADGFLCSGAVAVSQNARWLVYQSMKGSIRRILVYDRESGENRLFYEGEKAVEHTVFPPKGEWFYFVDQSAQSAKARVHFANCRTFETHVFNLEGKYLDADGYGLAHPAFDFAGDFLTDCIWHSDDERGIFRYLRTPASVYTDSRIHDEGEIRMYYAPVSNWNIHFNPTPISDWWVGSGGDNQGYVNGRKEINFFRLMPSGGVQFYYIAQKLGRNFEHPGVCATLSADLRYVFFNQLYDGEAPCENSNLFAVETPEGLIREIRGETPIPLCDVDPLTRGDYRGKYGDLAVYNACCPEENFSLPGYAVEPLERAGRIVWKRDAGGYKTLGYGVDCATDYAWKDAPLTYGVHVSGRCKLSVYTIDYEENGRRSVIWLESESGEQLSYPCEITDYPDGVYYSFIIEKDVRLKVVCSQTSVLVSGVFLSEI